MPDLRTGSAGVSEFLRKFVAEMPYERGPILEFVMEAAKAIPAGARVRTSAPATRRTASCSPTREYVTIDWAESVHEGARRSDIVASADAIPVRDGAFDAVLLTQVLEHVPEPARCWPSCTASCGLAARSTSRSRWSGSCTSCHTTTTATPPRAFGTCSSGRVHGRRRQAAQRLLHDARAADAERRWRHGQRARRARRAARAPPRRLLDELADADRRARAARRRSACSRSATRPPRLARRR